MKKPAAIPFDFILDELESLSPRTNPMFGCTAVYVGLKIVLILRNKSDFPDDNGVWLATTADHHESLKKDFPEMRSLGLFGRDGPTAWQNLPAESPAFEDSALRACELIRRGDPRIGKIPKGRKISSASKKKKKIKKIEVSVQAKSKKTKNLSGHQTSLRKSKRKKK